jgi:uncharacterized protein
MLLQTLLYLILGSVSGTLSGLLGIGGGSLITPALIYWFGYKQHLAQGTTLILLVPPIGLMAALAYYQQGYVDVKAGMVLGFGFFFGSALGAKLAILTSESLLRKMFAMMLIIIAMKMFVDK